MTPYRSTTRGLARFAWLALVLAAASCDRGAPGAGSTGGAATASASTSEALVARSAARWKHMVAAEWIEVYGFLSAAQKRERSLPQFLEGKSSHRYEQPTTPHVLHLDGARAFVSASCLWTPVHPLLQNLKLEEGQTVTQSVDMIETWVLEEGIWRLEEQSRARDFYTAHPGLLTASKGSAPGQ